MEKAFFFLFSCMVVGGLSLGPALRCLWLVPQASVLLVDSWKEKSPARSR